MVFYFLFVDYVEILKGEDAFYLPLFESLFVVVGSMGMTLKTTVLRRREHIVVRGVILVLFFCFVGWVVWACVYKASINLATERWTQYELSRLLQDNPERQFCFAVLSDTKLGSASRRGVLVECLRRIQADPEITFVVYIGDAVAGVNPKLYNLFYKMVKQDLKKPLLMVPGNHDIGYLVQDVYIRFFGMRYYAFRYGDNGFIIVDASYPWALDAEQMRWLKKKLRDFSNLRRIFVFQHQPLLDPRRGKRHCLPSSLSEKLATLYRKHRISCLFTSHIHGYFEGVWRGVRYYITGGAGSQLAGDDPDHFFYHYLKVRVGEDDFEIEVVKIPPLSKPDDRLGYFERKEYEVVEWGRVVSWAGIAIILIVVLITSRRRHRKYKWKNL